VQKIKLFLKGTASVVTANPENCMWWVHPTIKPEGDFSSNDAAMDLHHLFLSCQTVTKEVTLPHQLLCCGTSLSRWRCLPLARYLKGNQLSKAQKHFEI